MEDRACVCVCVCVRVCVHVCIGDGLFSLCLDEQRNVFITFVLFGVQFEAVMETIDASPAEVKLLKSYEEREEEYEKARAQIFSQQSPLSSVMSYDLATNNNPRLTSRRYL